MNRIPTIGFISLGCPKNLVDSEKILSELRLQGYQLVSSYEGADLLIVNTCGFIDSAVQESLETIGEALAENSKVIVTGCLGTKENLIRELHPKVLEISGPHSYEQVVLHVNKYLPKPSYSPYTSLSPDLGVKLTPKHYAYLKISEGCDHNCTFCIIPSLRGKLESRPIDNILDEAKRLAAAGVKELLVISQDTSAYGMDTKNKIGFWQGKPVKTTMLNLCEELASLGIWVRLHYVYPYPSVDQIIPLMRDGKVLPYLDIPLQHASPKILKLMKRPGSIERTLERIQKWREICPEITLRSTFIVGFPGETEEDFQLLLDFLQAAQLDRVGCFQYSAIEGAKANELPEPISEEIKQQRYNRFMQAQQQISINKLQQRIGKNELVIIDNITSTKIIGRSRGDAPEIDGLVYIERVADTEALSVGDIIQVHIEQADEYDLYARYLTKK